jgi:hypothetical protein
VPLGSGKQFIEREDLGLIEVAPVEFERLLSGPVNTTRTAKLVQVPEDQE